MGLEFVCGKCGRRLSYEEAATVVACPDCHALLPPVGFESSVAPKAPPEREGGTDSADFTLIATATGATAGDETSFLLDEADMPDEPRTTIYDRKFSELVMANAAAGDGSAESAAATVPESGDVVSPPVIYKPPVVSESPVVSKNLVDSESPTTIQNATRNAPPAVNVGPLPARGGPSPFLFRLAVSYASAITLVCLYLLYLLFNPSPSVDLPDIKPHTPKESNRVTLLEYVRPENLLPRLHMLRVGQSERYGSVRITPLRVTRGPLSFAFPDAEANESRPDSQSVLQLHLRIENVSQDQEFAPLDRQLVFTKEPDGKKFGWYKANNFVCRVGERAAHDRHVMVYDLSPDSSWQIRGENLDRELKPGESVETFIPTTEEGWESLSGDLVWRVHLRKGYNPDSFRGVTTLVEVLFNSAEIVDETPAVAGLPDWPRQR
ncbi:MAG: hypothetical protein EXS05_02595 [Planctomycetaceae bacterium]|nr:hypothetical protein [Planctomycetaceae bacterium]